MNKACCTIPSGLMRLGRTLPRTCCQAKPACSHPVLFLLTNVQCHMVGEDPNSCIKQSCRTIAMQIGETTTQPTSHWSGHAAPVMFAPVIFDQVLHTPCRELKMVHCIRENACASCNHALSQVICTRVWVNEAWCQQQPSLHLTCRCKDGRSYLGCV